MKETPRKRPRQSSYLSRISGIIFVEKNSVMWRKSVWRKNDKYEVWAETATKLGDQRRPRIHQLLRCYNLVVLLTITAFPCGKSVFYRISWHRPQREDVIIWDERCLLFLPDEAVLQVLARSLTPGHLIIISWSNIVQDLLIWKRIC